jgi:hypothetical protein
MLLTSCQSRFSLVSPQSATIEHEDLAFAIPAGDRDFDWRTD